MKNWNTIHTLLNHHPRVAMVSVVEARGSTPREPGARMVVAPDGTFRGTIGGGTLEYHAIDEARRALAGEGPHAFLSHQVLGTDLGQCCGGTVRLLYEVLDRGRLEEIQDFARREAETPFTTIGEISASGIARRIIDEPGFRGCRLAEDNTVLEGFGESLRAVYLFGAGHVGKALMLALAPLPFDVFWVDARASEFPSVLPASIRPVHTTDEVAVVREAPAKSFIVVMTHSHALDQRIIFAALALERFDYVGLIGSKSKRARFMSRLREAGLSDQQLAQLVCPIGIETITSKQPAAIALGVAAQLLGVDERLNQPVEHKPQATPAVVVS